MEHRGEQGVTGEPLRAIPETDSTLTPGAVLEDSATAPGIRGRVKVLGRHLRAHPLRTLGGVATLVALFVMFAPDSTKGLVVRETVEVRPGVIRKELPATGIIKPVEGAEVKTGSRFTGVIRRLYAKLGDRVAKDQVVAELDDREQQSECRRQEATLRRLKAELRQVETTYPLRIAEAAAQEALARAESDYAEASFRRQAPLDGGGVSRDGVEKARSDLAVKRQSLRLASAARQRVEQEFTTSRTRLREAVAEAEADLDAARIRLSYARITSPMDGVVSEITAQEGETLVTGLQVAYLITVLDPSRLELQVYIDENDIGMISPGASVTFSVEAHGGQEFSGVIELIHPGAEIRNNIVYYRALVRLAPKTALALRPEMTARCRILVAHKENALIVPNTAFKWLGTRRVVFVRDASGDVAPVTPQTGIEGLTHTEILGGIEPGTTVVLQLDLPSPLPEEWK